MSNTGIIRTDSNRLTYAPDGLYDNLGTHPAHTHASSSHSPTLAESYETLPASGDEGLSNVADVDELRRIATRDSSLYKVDTLAIPEDDPSRNPADNKFNLYKWARNFLNDFDQEGLRAVRSGVVFKELSVSGSGAALQLQQTVFSMLLDPIRNLSFKSKPHRRILNQFNGYLASGELLIVLGRPGSGCSTFLKTICGELHGLELENSSEIHYNGVPQKQMMKNFSGEVVYNQEVWIPSFFPFSSSPIPPLLLLPPL